MDDKALRLLLTSVKRGDTSLSSAVDALRDMPYEDIGFARIDHHRALRKGFPEVVFCQGKRPEQSAEIVVRLAQRHRPVLATRADPATFAAIRARVADAVYHEVPSAVVIGMGRARRKTGPFILVLTAGTSDLYAAEEAALTAEVMGSRVERLSDVGVSGIHRLLEHRKRLDRAGVVIVVAGMEGALPS
ncbi:MAG: 1-(5-phosphoribosyl)-5-amino-4-imidazole-carboxylate carboxylase, partial [Acidobacteria bacterium]|nr:1-(5-phosphoribosyl)-5-amino-4-imidazole-carboxylate carboxylase [Acidobacteriota bacterium]